MCSGNTLLDTQMYLDYTNFVRVPMELQFSHVRVLILIMSKTVTVTQTNELNMKRVFHFFLRRLFETSYCKKY